MSLNFKATNIQYSCDWLKEKLKKENFDVLYRKKEKLKERYLHMHCTVQSQTLLLFR